VGGFGNTLVPQTPPTSPTTARYAVAVLSMPCVPILNPNYVFANNEDGLVNTIAGGRDPNLSVKRRGKRVRRRTRSAFERPPERLTERLRHCLCAPTLGHKV
jgi:hypothetical protein